MGKLNKKGFTLIEVVTSMVLIGILALVAGFGLVKVSQGYLFARQNSETVQKAQIAMARIVKELSAATQISPSSTAHSITYTRPEAINNTIEISENRLRMSGAVQGILTDAIVAGGSGFQYYDAQGNSINPTAGATDVDIRRVDVTLSVRGAGGHISEFKNSVSISKELI
jgi:prepilin-type N-terminal cleavage/methylation domain-containing protein